MSYSWADPKQQRTGYQNRILGLIQILLNCEKPDLPRIFERNTQGMMISTLVEQIITLWVLLGKLGEEWSGYINMLSLLGFAMSGPLYLWKYVRPDYMNHHRPQIKSKRSSHG